MSILALSWQLVDHLYGFVHICVYDGPVCACVGSVANGGSAYVCVRESG